MRIWTLELILEQIKTFGTIETEWMHSEYKKKMNFGGPGAECYGLNSVSPKFICWNPNTWCDSIWRWALWEIFNFRCHKGRALMMRLVSCLKKKKSGGTHQNSLSLPCGNTVRRCPLQDRKSALTRTDTCWHCDLRAPASRNMRKYISTI